MEDQPNVVDWGNVALNLIIESKFFRHIFFHQEILVNYVGTHGTRTCRYCWPWSVRVRFIILSISLYVSAQINILWMSDKYCQSAD